MMSDTDRVVVRERDGDRDRYRKGVSQASGGEEEISRGSWDRDRGGGRSRIRETDNSRFIDRDRRIGNESLGHQKEQTGHFSEDRSRRYNDNDEADFRKRELHADERRPMGRDRGRDYDADERRPMSRDRGRDYDADERQFIGRDRRQEYDDDVRRPMGRDWNRDRDYDDDERGRDRDREHDDDERREIGGGRGRGRGGRGRGGGGRGRGDSDKPVAPPLYTVVKATVHSIRPFGIFVQIEGYRNHGLVHLSQVSDHEVTKRDDSEEAKVKALSSVVNEGEQVWIKVISVKVEEDGSTKVGCSMKYVSQGDGTDLDPNNIQAEKQQSRPSWKEPQKFKLEAVYNVQCERCGGHGHLKKECYSSGDKAYKLLSDDEDADLTVQNPSKSKERFPMESTKDMQPLKLAAGFSNHSLATGSMGRGRAVVQPAWMKHGIGVGGPAPPEADTEQKLVSALPEKMETVEDALAVIAMLKEEKQRRKEERHRKKERRHRSKDEKKDKHKKRHRSEKEPHSKHKKRRDLETSDEDDHKERKKRRVVSESDEDDQKEHKNHRDVREPDEEDHNERKKHRDEKDSKERHKTHLNVGNNHEGSFKERKKYRDADDVTERYRQHHDDDFKARRSSHSRHHD